jgi:hypothetical protein
LGTSVFAGCGRIDARGGSRETDEETLDRTDRRPAPLANEYQRAARNCKMRLGARVSGAFVRKLLPRLGFSCATSAISGEDAKEDAVVVSHSVVSRQI